ncbi:DNA polymerase IV [Pasteurellaceae bacterium USgator11]|nr:DNA polymerase IV [Pasteurellaceae bacterium UScroc12]TNG97059.1 DNA polymerase IV [Pasteurellaceae bacterium UScroc31]TNG97408.1 DNA polymerase IV [Pasteurellaceae bacterium USgator41]TNH00720.1 DNA polymerase IV [Pasteurellaceae bacterium USgator11]
MLAISSNKANFERKIIHIDMDCFFAAVEIREQPSLAGKPVAVGGAADSRGVLSTCNYEARQYGLHSAMPTALALKKCPNLVLLRGNMALYKQVSEQVQAIFRRYTTIIEPLSLDEAYLDVTDCTACNGSATWIAAEIRRAIFTELQLTASAGVAPLKFLAKIASEINKPNGQFVLAPEQVDQFVLGLALKKIPGVGPVTAQKLSAMGLTTCADVRQLKQHILLDQFGKLGQRIWQFSHAIDERAVQSERERKSVGVEVTLSQDIWQVAQAEDILQSLYQKLIVRLQRIDPDTPLSQYRKIGVKLKFNDFQTTTLESSGYCLNLNAFRQLLQQIWQRANGRSIRLIGLNVALLAKNNPQQLSLW